ncbi:MAG: transporter permease [Clostridia bacterium]|jgi:putative ABC transport system permease protein|nr:transporter permease [Clostridia bacterium]
MFKESIKMSWQNIIHNKVRSLLTILGIVIGVASIIALITIVQGATDSVTSQVESIGADKITIQTQGTPLKQGLLNSDVKKLAEVENVLGVAPTITGRTAVVYDKTVKEDVVVQGKNEVYFSKTEDLIQSGRGINILDIESKGKVSLIGQNIVDELFWGQDPIGKELTVGGVTYTVIGTLQGSSGFSMTSNDDAVIIPYTTAMSFLGTKYISSVDVYMSDSVYSGAITTSIETVLKEAFNYNEDGYVITNMQDILDTISQMTNTLSLMLAGIASISLIVGGIGIMNMMLVSVTERTTEIGLRKALGAKPQRIQQQFLMEAIFLSCFGGIMGLLIGVAIAYGVCILIGTVFSLSAGTVALALGFSASIGIVFGFAPARKASQLNPIEALRSI